MHLSVIDFAYISSLFIIKKYSMYERIVCMFSPCRRIIKFLTNLSIGKIIINRFTFLICENIKLKSYISLAFALITIASIKKVIHTHSLSRAIDLYNVFWYFNELIY